MRKAIQFIIDVIFKTLILIFSIYLIMSIFGFKFYIVPTGSMEPNIHAGSLVLINENVDYKDVEVGDVIVYNQSSNRKIIHRVIEKTDEGIVVKGDANPVPDGGYITTSNYIGRFMHAIPGLGEKLNAMNNIPCKVAYISVMLGLCLLDWILDATDSKKKDNYNERGKARTDGGKIEN